MRNCNFGETNGILVGPEISRIFSEIIFQRIDANVKGRLTENYNLHSEEDFVVRRYIDDIYIFSNNQSAEDTVKDQYEVELSKYKLYLNQAKHVNLQRPFYTNISSAKDSLFVKSDAFFDAVLVKLEPNGNIVRKNAKKDKP